MYCTSWQSGFLPWEDTGSELGQFVQMEVEYHMRRPTEYRNCILHAASHVENPHQGENNKHKTYGSVATDCGLLV